MYLFQLYRHVQQISEWHQVEMANTTNNTSRVKDKLRSSDLSCELRGDHEVTIFSKTRLEHHMVSLMYIRISSIACLQPVSSGLLLLLQLMATYCSLTEQQNDRLSNSSLSLENTAISAASFVLPIFHNSCRMSNQSSTQMAVLENNWQIFSST